MSGQTAVLMGAGDMGDCGLPGTALTARLLSGSIFTLGDHAYPNGNPEDFRDCYDPHWGRFRAATRPTPGNHDNYERGSRVGRPYYEYFGSNAGNGSGYYSYDAGAWHVISLNSEIMDRGSQEQAHLVWLRADLAARDVACTLVYFHRPLFSSGANAAERMRRVWEVLYPAGVDLVLNGHEHFYERFAPQDPGGRPDVAFGIRQLIVGTGGARFLRAGARAANSEMVIQGVWGVAKLTLSSTGYNWEFIDVDRVVRDSGSGRCHGKPVR